MILYGWNSYLLKSVSPLELGMLSADQPDFSIEYRQRYFHLFFIPFFPIGRIWAVRQGGKLYHASAELEQALQQVNTGSKHRIWAWSGPLLGIAIWIIVSISNSIEEKAYQNRTEKNKTVLAAFFNDRNKTTPLAHKLKIMNSLIDSSLSAVKYENKAIDTSANELTNLYWKIALTQSDPLKGYDQNNTFVISDFHDDMDRNQIITKEYQASLEAGDWKGYYSDTASVFTELRKLEQYKYILLLKEYNRLEPQVEGSGFASGYSLVQGSILSIETGKELKNFRIMAGNSEQVNHYSMSNDSYAGSSSGVKQALENDLKRNVLKEAGKYVFGAENLY